MWYQNDIPTARLWWAVEHNGHAAFYLRTFMRGDFAPGKLPLPRHASDLDGVQLEAIVCGTCGEVPAAQHLEVFERVTQTGGFLAALRARRLPWPKPTDPATCWLCSTPGLPLSHVVAGRDVCARCAEHMIAAQE